MSFPRDEKPLPELDEAGKAYREAGFDDEPPAHVDAFVRAAAKRAAKRSFNDYLPSLAMAATLVLAFGLVLRLTVPGGLIGSPESLPAPAAEDANASRQVLQQQPAPSADSAEPAAALEETAASAAAGADFEESAAPAQAPPAALEIAPVMPAPSAAVADEPALEGVASRAVGRMAVPPSVPCPDSEREQPDLWLVCISAQVDAAMLDAAQAELEAFRLAYPDVAVPANIAERLAP